MGDNLDLAIALLGDLYCIAQITNAAVDLDSIVQEFLESRDVKDLVTGRLRSIDNELETS